MFLFRAQNVCFIEKKPDQYLFFGGKDLYVYLSIIRTTDNSKWNRKWSGETAGMHGLVWTFAGRPHVYTFVWTDLINEAM